MHPKLTVRIGRLIVDLLRDIGLIPFGGSSKPVLSAEIYKKLHLFTLFSQMKYKSQSR